MTSAPANAQSVCESVKVALVNCRSIVNKIPELEVFTTVEEPDIIIGTESWLTPEISSSEVFPDRYNVFRKDRKGKVGGGVFILAKKELVCSEIELKS